MLFMMDGLDDDKSPSSIGPGWVKTRREDFLAILPHR